MSWHSINVYYAQLGNEIRKILKGAKKSGQGQERMLIKNQNTNSK
jgi:hypothetical protein